MGDQSRWSDQERSELREAIRTRIMGELRLALRGRPEIIQLCREVYIDDSSPDGEREGFAQLAAEEFDRAAARHATAQAEWPEATDCDRLDRVEAALRDRGILLWQVSPCCDTCTTAEIRDRINGIERRHPGFRERVRGYAFFIDQNMPQMLSEGEEIGLYLGYGWMSSSGSSVAPERYEEIALGVGREVSECLRDEGFTVDWDGKLSRKIGISLVWRRRTPVE